MIAKYLLSPKHLSIIYFPSGLIDKSIEIYFNEDVGICAVNSLYYICVYMDIVTIEQ